MPSAATKKTEEKDIGRKREETDNGRFSRIGTTSGISLF